MTSIQGVLITFSFLAAIILSFAFRSRLVGRLLAAFFFCVATACIILPDTTTRVAHALGVGRGADLLLYVTVFAGIHAFLVLYLRTRRLERQITEQVRASAIRDAQWLGS